MGTLPQRNPGTRRSHIFGFAKYAPTVTRFSQTARAVRSVHFLNAALPALHPSGDTLELVRRLLPLGGEEVAVIQALRPYAAIACWATLLPPQPYPVTTLL